MGWSALTFHYGLSRLRSSPVPKPRHFMPEARPTQLLEEVEDERPANDINDSRFPRREVRLDIPPSMNGLRIRQGKSRTPEGRRLAGSAARKKLVRSSDSSGLPGTLRFADAAELRPHDG